MEEETFKQKAQQTYKALQEAESVLLHLHPSPDPDSAGSALATMHILKGIGKKTTVIAGDSPLHDSFMALPGSEKIVQKTYGEVDTAQFDTFVILDVSDKKRISSRSEVVFPDQLTTIVIDHHVSNEEFGDINLVDTGAASTTQILYELFNYWGVDITPDIALNLLVGIYFDTVFFTTPLTTVRSVEIFSELVKQVPDFYKTITAIQNSRTKQEVIAEGMVVSSAEDYCNGRVGIAAVSYDAFTQRNIDFSTLPGKVHASSLLRGASGWHIIATLTEEQPEETRVSLRTLYDKKYNLSILAEKLGGGGHPGAAGATLHMPAEEAKKKVLTAIKETFPQLQED